MEPTTRDGQACSGMEGTAGLSQAIGTSRPGLAGGLRKLRGRDGDASSWKEDNRDLRKGNWVILGLDNEGLLWIRYGGGESTGGSPQLKGKKSKKSGVVSVR